MRFQGKEGTVERGGNKVVLVNLLNNRRDEALAKDDPVSCDTIIDHGDLLEWAIKTGCEPEVRNMWSTASGEYVNQFIGFIDDGDPTELAILRNPSGSQFALDNDTIAFWAKRLPKPLEYAHPNKITRKGGQNVSAD